MALIPPGTLEGWYVLHQTFSTDWPAARALGASGVEGCAAEAEELLRGWSQPDGGGWSAAFQLVAGGADWMFLHFRSDLEGLADVQRQLRRSRFGELLRPGYDYLSVTEAGLYHATARAAREAEPRSAEFERLLTEAAEEELATPHIRIRLFPEVPEGMRYVSFYPMNKRRAVGQNWYSLPIEERNRLMREHGLTGRRYARRVFQVISGSVGLDDWEWGVTLFAHDPLEFKRIVTEMRYDEASAMYGEFGSFFTGIRVEPGSWADLLGAGRRAG
jgi:hydrogen peroxide-dependent heme synthase